MLMEHLLVLKLLLDPDSFHILVMYAGVKSRIKRWQKVNRFFNWNCVLDAFGPGTLVGSQLTDNGSHFELAGKPIRK